MEYKLLHCEECDNVVSVKDNNRAIFVCPVCGVLNKRKQTTSYFGKLIITSPQMNCELNDVEEGVISIPNANDDILHAIMILNKFGWSMKFLGTKNKD
jgi:RNA polymerase subunit RPABC4/transcription elongation factor Spt4